MARNKKRADGRFDTPVYLGVDEETGEKKYKHCYGKTQREADEKALRLKIELGRGIDVKAGRDTFGLWADRWLEHKSKMVAAKTLSAKRLASYKCNLKHLSDINEAEIIKIKAYNLQVLIDNLSEKLAKATLESIRSVANQVFRMAIRNRVMDYNPALDVEISSNVKTKGRALTDEEQQWITGTYHRAQRAAMIMMLSGLRRGELFPLLWTDINLVEKTISVTKSVEILSNEAIEKEGGKSQAATRIVDIPDMLVDYLAKEKKDSIYVCPKADGRMHTGTSWRKMWDSYKGELNRVNGDFSPYLELPKSKFDPKGTPVVIPNITPHMLRHTFCTLLYLAGVDVLVAMQQMGHKDIKTTLEVYTHLDRKYKRNSMSKLDEYLYGKSNDAFKTTGNVVNFFAAKHTKQHEK